MRIINYLKHISNDIIYVAKNGMFHILSGNILIKTIQFISSIILIRMVDKTIYAHYLYADNIYSYIDLLSGLGIYTALIKYCSINKDPQKDIAYLSFAAKFGSVFQILSSILLCIIVVVFFRIPFSGARVFLWVLVMYPFFNFGVILLQSYRRAHLDYKAYSLIGLINAILVFSANIIFVYLFDVMGSVIARYLSVIITLVYAVVITKKRIPKGNIPVKLSMNEKKEFLALGISLMISTFCSSVMPINETFLVNNIIKDEIISSNFRVAGLIPQQLMLLTGAITVYYFPIFSSMKDYKLILKKSIKVGLLTGVIIIVFALFGILSSPLMIRLVYGNQYIDAIKMSYFLWIMRALNAGFRMIPINILPAIGEHKFIANLAIASSVIHLIVDYYFIKTIGIMGIAYATIFIYLLTGIIAWIYLFYVCKKKVREEEVLCIV